MADNRTPEVIEQDLIRARERLAENLSQLVTEIHPRAVLHRTIRESRRKVNQTVVDTKDKIMSSGRYVMRYFKDESGWKPASLIAAGVVVVAVLGTLVLKKK